MSAPDEPLSPAEDRIVRARARRQLHADDDDPVPRLPRGKGLRLSAGQLLKIGLTAAVLVMLLVVQRPCADNVSKFVIDFDQAGSASQALPRPDNLEPGAAEGEPLEADDYLLIPADMTQQELEQALREKLGQPARSGSEKAAPAGSAGAKAAPAGR